MIFKQVEAAVEEDDGRDFMDVESFIEEPGNLNQSINLNEPINSLQDHTFDVCIFFLSLL